jgi:hypothetical protein
MPDKPSVLWWGEYHIPLGKAGRWRIGPLSLWVERLPGEWRLAYEKVDDPLDTNLEIEIPATPRDLLSFGTALRYAAPGDHGKITLEPQLADRPVIAHPEKLFHVPPGQAITLYVSTPLWLKLSTTAPNVSLTEFPISRPTDTWFGPSPREGELCYATTTYCRLQLEELPRRPHRAVTAARIENQVDTMLPVDRILLPVKHLSIYETQDGTLWTQDITFERSEHSDFASLKLRQRAPQQVGGGKLLHGPRVRPSANIITRAFSSLFT